MFLEQLEHRVLLAADLVADPIFAPGTPQEYVDNWQYPQGADPNGQNNGGTGNLPPGASPFQLTPTRWTTTASGTSPNLGDQVTLTWGIVADGTILDDGTSQSDLVAFMDGIYGGGTGPVSSRVWFPLFEGAYNDWGALSGINMVFEPNDDGAQLTTGIGQLGVRPDLRIGGRNIDGNYGVLAFNFFPSGSVATGGDMVIDTGDIFYSLNADPLPGGQNLGIRNMLRHEIGHGIGLMHVEPVNQTKLMEPFISFAFDGPQHDDIQGVQRLYGDALEPNDSLVNATQLGTFVNGKTAVLNVSIDDDSDTDLYGISLPEGAILDLRVTPAGFSYLQGPQGGPFAPFDSSMQNDLSLELINSRGDVIASSTNAAIGFAEQINTLVFEPGNYTIRITGADDATQLYTLNLDAKELPPPPALVSVNPNDGGILDPLTANVLNFGPRELVFHFTSAEDLDPNTLGGIRITRSGGDDDFNNGFDVITPGYLDFGETGSTVIARFAEALPDDLYRIEVFGVDIPVEGIVAVRNLTGSPFEPEIAGTDRDTIFFDLQLAPQVTAVIPQPVTRDSSGGLAQDAKKIVVYFSDEGLNQSTVESPTFYRLIETNLTATEIDDTLLLPKQVTFDAVANAATLEFASDIPAGTYRLSVGESDESNNTIASASNVGTLFDGGIFTTLTYLGDDVSTGSESVDDVDLFQVRLLQGQEIQVTVGPAAGLDAIVRVFDEAGTQLDIVNTGGNAAVETLSFTAPTDGSAPPDAAYYIGISSGDVYDPTTAGGSTGGATFGGYSLEVEAVAGNPVSLSDDNSSFATATGLGVLGIAGQDLSAQIEQQFFINSPVPIGGNDEPGHRHIPVSDHLNEFGLVLGTNYDTTPGLTTITYNFQTNYGTVQGTAQENEITPTQRQRAREVFELLGDRLGVQFEEADCTGTLDGSCAGLTIATGDIRAIDPTLNPNGLDAVLGDGKVILNGTHDFGQSEYGGVWFQTMMREIGRLLGLGDANDLPSIVGLNLTAEPVFPSDHDILHLQRLHQPDSNDIDLYRFELTSTGILTAETIAERLPEASKLDTTLSLFAEDALGNQELIARNDDYFSRDSLIEVELAAGTYYLGVSSTGNADYDPTISDTGSGGRTEGVYDLQVGFASHAASNIEDDTNIPLDGDFDSQPGGAFDFWFQAGNTVFVDKTNDPRPGLSDGTGTINDPFDNIPAALLAANNSAADKIVRIVGNPGSDGDLKMRADNLPYLIGLDDLSQPLPDGVHLEVPQNVTVMIDEGALLKLHRANVDVGTSAQNNIRSGGALQVLGTPDNAVFFRSYRNDAEGGDSDGPNGAASSGDWGGIVFRDDSDHDNEAEGGVLNVVQQADINNGGGKVFVSSIEETFSAIHLIESRPAITFNTITNSSDAALSADPNSFSDARGRVGPSIHGNRVIGNSVNGVFVRIQTEFGSAVDKLTSFARWDDKDIVHVLSENLLIAGTPGGPLLTYDTQELDYVGTPTDGTFRLQLDDGDAVRVTGDIRFDAPLNTSTNEIQSIAVAGATGGAFNLGFNGSSLLRQEVIPYNATAIQVRDSLESLDTIERGDVVVTGGPLGFSPVEVEFVGQHTGTDVPLLSVVNNTINRTQSIDATGATVGTFNLSFDEASVALQVPINFNADTVDVQAALESLSTINNGDILVTGGPLNVAPIEVEFTGAFAGMDVPALSVSANTLDVGPAVSDIEPVDIQVVADAVMSVREHLELLAGISPNDFELTGGPLSQAPVRLQFAGQFTAHDIPGVSIDTDAVVGATPTVTDLADAGVSDHRLDARLQIDPGVIVKLSSARIHAEVGAQLIAEGTGDLPILFTSVADDRFGVGGTFDTQSDGNATVPAGGDWAGLVFTPTSEGSLDHIHQAFAGGQTAIEGTFANFNAIEIHQADVRIANSLIEENAGGITATSGSTGGGGTVLDRGTLTANAAATIFVRGSQPTIINNVIRRNNDPGGTVAAISINTNALNSERISDPGRTTGFLDQLRETESNHGPLVLENRLVSNGVNGIFVRGEELTTEGVWDDTDIVHVVTSNIQVPNLHGLGGLTLQSKPTESLVIKFQSGASGAGFTATGLPSDISDRIGGAVQVLGQPGFPVVLTALSDCTVGAGFTSEGLAQLETLGGACGGAVSGGFTGVTLDQFSNDRNVAVFNEIEPAFSDGLDTNAIPGQAQFLGDLAPNEQSGDENRRLGFEVRGAVSFDDPGDVDVYSFSAESGTEVWFDIDRTASTLDTVVELIDSQGQFLARSLDNDTLSGGVQPSVTALHLLKDEHDGPDWFSSNLRDAGMRVVLPGLPGLNTYFVRVRSQPAPGNENDTSGGLTRGDYQLQVRLRQKDEEPGSTVRHADIRFATNGIHIQGLPEHSSLAGDEGETTATHNSLGSAQSLGNLLITDKNTISVGGDLAASNEVDWYSFTLDYNLVDASLGADKSFATAFDIDYADGLTRADTVLAVYDENGRLILMGRDSDISDDRPKPNESSDLDDLSRGTVGVLDPFIGTVQLPAGNRAAGSSHTYFVAVASNGQIPTAITSTLSGAPNTSVRLEPISSVQRIVEDHIGFTGFVSNIDADGRAVEVLPQHEEPILDIHSIESLSTSVRPFSLEDVQLFVTDPTLVSTINPRTGEVVLSNLAASGPLFQATGFVDLDMRSDGRLVGYRDIPTNPTVAGVFDEFDVGTIPGALLDSLDYVNLPSTPNAAALTSFVSSRNGGTTTQAPTVSYRYFLAVHEGSNSRLFNSPGLLGVTPTNIGLVSGLNGLITGLQAVGSRLFAVTNAGEFAEINPINAAATSVVDFSANVVGRGVPFSGLTLGPQNVEGGAYADTLFAVTTNGWMYAMDQFGKPANVFTPSGDANGDGATDASDAFGVPISIANAQGLAFSPLDFNLWHPTARRGQTDQPGHGVTSAFDDSKLTSFQRNNIGLPGDPENRIQQDSQGGASFYFGLDQFVSNTQFTNYRYHGSNQFGIIDANAQFDLSSNSTIRNTYNLPGGSQGSLVTDEFSLQGYSGTDKPTLYFNYFLQTENATGSNNGGFLDSARVFVSRDEGASWELVATNNSLTSTDDTGDAELPSFASASRDAWAVSPNQGVQQLYNGGGWRQARIDLADFAGESDLQLRFDFSTAGNLNDPTLPAIVEASGQGLNDLDRALNNRFEGFYVDDIIVGFTERGELVTGAPQGSTAFTAPPRNPDAPQELLTGDYQLEIRRSTEIIESRLGELGNPVSEASTETLIFRQFDTNDRLTSGRSLSVPEGASVLDGQLFSISDGILDPPPVFEFDSNGVWDSNHVRLEIAGTETAGEVAHLVVDAINGIADFVVIPMTKPLAANSPTIDLLHATLIDVTTGNEREHLFVDVADATIAETGANNSTIATITRTGDLSSDLLGVTVMAIDPATGLITDEVTLSSATVDFVSGVATAQVTITGNADLIADLTQPVKIVVAAPTGPSIPVTPGNLDVLDVESAQLTLGIDLASISELGGSAVGTVTRNTTNTGPLDVNLVAHLTNVDPNPGTGTIDPRAAREISIPISVTIPANANDVTFAITAIDDDFFDGDQVVSVTAFSDGLGSDTQTLTVLDEGDLLLELTATQIDEPPGTVTMTTGRVTRSGSTAGILTVTIEARDLQSPFAFSDEVDLTGVAVGNPVTVEIPDGAAFATFDITARLDSISDGDQTIEIVAKATINSLQRIDSELLDVIDANDPTLSIEVGTSQLSEAYSNSFAQPLPATYIRIVRSGDLDNDATVTFDATGPDITLPFSTVTIPAGRAFVDVPVLTINDTLAAPNDPSPTPTVITARLSPTIFATATLEIDDNEDNYIVGVFEDSVGVVAQGVILEDSGSVANTANVVVRRPFTGDDFTVTVDASPSGSVRIPAGDTFAPDTADAIFAANQTARPITLDTIPNAVTDHEREVTFTVTGGATTSLFVADDEDPSLTVTIDRPVISEAGERASVTVTRQNNSQTGSPLQVFLAVFDPERAGSPASDEVAIVSPITGALVPSLALIIPACDATTTVPECTEISFFIEGLPDGIIDADYDLDGDGSRQRAVVSASVLPTSAVLHNRAIASIYVHDADLPLSLVELTFLDRNGNPTTSINERDGMRAARGVITVNNLEGRDTRSVWRDANSAPITFTVQATDAGGADATGDEVNIYGGDLSNVLQVILPAGSSTVEFDIDSLDDLLLDGNQAIDFALTASDPRLGGISSTLTVADNPPPPRGLLIEVVDGSSSDVDAIDEGNAAEVRVTRTGDVTLPLTVTVVGSPEVELNGGMPAVLSFNAGEATAMMTIPILGVVDGLADGTRTVIVDVDRSTPELNGYDIITDQLDIVDLDIAELTVSILGPVSFAEDAGAGASSARVTRNTPNDQPLVVSLMSSDPTEARTAPTVTIPAGLDWVDFSIDAVDELLTDGPFTDVAIMATASEHLTGTAVVNVESVDNANDYERLGDVNLEREQGHIVIGSNRITGVSGVGILVSPGVSPNSALRGPEPNTANLVPGITLVNNIVAEAGMAAVSASGNGRTVPFLRIVNNTFFGGNDSNGVELSSEVSATILNNIFSDVTDGVVVASDNGTAEVILGANLFHMTSAQGADAIEIADTDPLFVDADTGNFYLVAGSLAIDSSRNSLADRGSYVNVKAPLGIPPSPILAPERDVFGQLRVDDPSQNSSFGFGSDVFKDRGAVDRADVLGPFAVLTNPVDRIGELTPPIEEDLARDLDPNETVVHVKEGNPREFSILLKDGRGGRLPFEGTGIDAATINENTVRLFENGRELFAGVDFTLGYAHTSATILLTPASGVWRPASAYTILLNNKDRLLLNPPSVLEIADGDQFTVSDNSNGTAVFEFERGYTLEVPELLTFELPIVGVQGGIRDGDTFTITGGAPTPTVFEFNRNSIFDPNNVLIPFTLNDSLDDVADSIVNILGGAGIGLEPENLGNGRVHLGIPGTHSIDLTGTRIALSGTAEVVGDGDLFSFSFDDGTTVQSVMFEFDRDGIFDPNNTQLPYVLQDTHEDLADRIVVALQAAGFNLPDIEHLGNGIIHIGGEVGHILDTAGTNLIQIGMPGVTGPLQLLLPASGGGLNGVFDGDQFTVRSGTQSVTFEFDNDGLRTANTVGIIVDTTFSKDDVANNVLAALQAANLGLNPQKLPNGDVLLGEPTGAVDFDLTINFIGNIGSAGVSGGAIPIPVKNTPEFTKTRIAGRIVKEINRSQLVDVVARATGDGKIILDGASTVTGINQTAIPAIRDTAGNALRANQPDGETRFTILTVGTGLDFGDAPDPFDGPLPFDEIPGRYPTLLANDGARHAVLRRNPLFFGPVGSDTAIDTETDAPTPASGLTDDLVDDNDELLGNGISINGVITPTVIESGEVFAFRTPVTIQSSGIGFVDAWIDFDQDGDWEDNEKVLDSEPVVTGFNQRNLEAPPVGAKLGTTFARFRISTVGGLAPDGIVVDGEVEDHVVTIISNVAPTATPMSHGPIFEDQIDVDPSQLVVDLTNTFDDADIVPRNDKLVIEIVSNDNPAIVQASLSGSTSSLTGTMLNLTQTANAHGEAVITLRATDHALRTVETSFTLVVQAVNDQPTLLLPPNQSGFEETPQNVPGIVVGDIDIDEGNGPQVGLITVTLSAPSGRLDVKTDLGNGVSLSDVQNNGTSTVTITSSIGAINNTFAAGTGLIYTGGFEFSGNAEVVVRVNDNGNSPAPDQERLGTITISVTATNDAPIITLPSTTGFGTLAEDTSETFTGLTVSDADAGSGDLRATLDVDNGILELVDASDVLFLNGTLDGSSFIELQGTLVGIDKAINGLTYRPSAHFNGLSGFVITVDDLGNTPGSLASGNNVVSRTVGLTVVAVNDPPSFTIASNPPPSNEDAGFQTVSSFVTDILRGPAAAVDETSQIVSFEIVNILTQGSDTLTFESLAIDSITGTLTYEAARDTNGTATVSVRLCDNGSPGTPSDNCLLGGVASAVQTFDITVNAINDAPQFVKGPNITIDEDSGAQELADWATGVAAGPPTATDEGVQTKTFTTPLLLNSDSELVFSSPPVIDPSGKLSFETAAHSNGLSVFRVALQDNESGVFPNINTSQFQTFTISVDAVNDAPTFNIAGLSQTINEDALLQTLPGFVTDISPGPPSPSDEDGQVLQFNVNFTGNLTFNVPPQVDASTGTLIYQPQANSNGSAVVMLTLVDSGSSVTLNVNASVPQSFTITVDPINDPPTFQLVDQNAATTQVDLTVDENDVPPVGGSPNPVQTVTDFATSISRGPSDEDAQQLAFDLTVQTLAGTLTFDVAPSISDVGELSFRAAPDTNGAAVISVRLSDDGNGSAPHINTSGMQTFTLSVNAVNDLPVVANPIADVDVDEDSASTEIELFPSVFADPDINPWDGDSLTLSVVGNTNPGLVESCPTGAATCTLPSSVLTLDYQENQSGVAEIIVQATDQIGTSVTDTFTVTVTAVNDAPVISGPTTLPATEDVVSALENLSITDVDSATGQLDVTLEVSDGILTINSVGGLSIVGNTNGTNRIALSGSAASLASMLSAATGLTYRGDQDFNGTDMLVITANDQGNTGNPPGATATLSADATIPIVVAAVNDPPTAGPDVLTTQEDVPVTFNASILRANDSRGPANESAQNLTAALPGGAIEINSTNGGTASISNGEITYTPPIDFVGTDTFVYEVTDDGLPINQSALGTVTVTITSVNDPPVPGEDTKIADEDTMLVFDAIDLLVNDGTGPLTAIDEVLEILTVTGVSPTSDEGGTVSLVSGAITYLPPADFAGTDTFTYTVVDDGQSNGVLDRKSFIGTVNVTVREVNDPPVVTDDTRTTAEDTRHVFNASVLTLNDEPGPANESNQPLTVASVSGTSSNGGVVALTSGVISYTPPLDYNGIDTFTYTVRDNGLTSGSSDVQTTTGTVTMIVTAVNDTPTATSDTATTAEDQPLVITGSSLAINDARGPSNESGQNLTITAVGASAQGGTVTLNAATGEIAYNPKQDFNGNDTFTYTIRDDGLTNGVLEPKTATATVTVTVTPVNDAPVAVTDQHTIPEDNALVLGASVLLGNDLRGPADPTIDQEETQTLMITDVSQDSSEGGTVTLIGSTLTYTPPADFNGLDTFTYTIVDNGRTGNDPDPKGASGTVSVTVSEVNDAPILRGAVATMFEDDTLILTPSELFLDDSAGPPDEAGVQTLAATSVSGTSERGGTVTLVNTINGMTVAYVPPANFNGLDTFVYTAVDNGETNGTLDPRSSTGTYTIDITPQNDAPTAVSDAFAGNEDAILQVAGEGVLGNDFDIDVPKDVLTVVNPGQITTDLGATVTIASDGTFSYDPTSSAALQSLADGQSDLDRFRYTVGDGTTTSNEATVRISVSGRNDAPVALDDTGFTVDEDSQLSVATSNSILLNDTDAEEPEVGAPMIGSLRAVRVSGPGNGSLNLNANGTFTYTPNPDFNGIDTFVYRANDGLTNSNPATVSITVAPGNDAPVAGGDVYSVNQDTTLAVNATDGVLRNDSDPDQLFPLTVELVNDPFNGDLQLSSSDGSFTYSPNASFVGTDTFTYRAIDSEGLRSLDTTVVINVLDTNPFQNPRNPLDVNNDGFVSPIDALLLTNEINANGSHALTTALANVPFPDTNGDGTISPIDVVQVINFLNNNSGLPEGESSAPAGLVRVAADVAPPTSAVFGHNVVGQPESPITQVSPDGAPIADEHQEFFGSLGDQEQAASDEQAIRASEDVADVKEDDFADALEELFGSSFDDLM